MGVEAWPGGARQRRGRTFGAEAPHGEAPPTASPGVGTSDLGDVGAVILVRSSRTLTHGNSREAEEMGYVLGI